MAVTIARRVRPARWPWLSTASGTSTAARTLETMAVELERNLGLGSMSLRPIDSLTQLERAAEEADHEGWDGYSGQAVSPDTVELASIFIDQLPAFVPPPDVTPEADGELSLEWHVAPWKTFSVSIGPQGRLTYSGLFGRMRNTRGTDVLGDVIPSTILDGLTRLLQV